jgi:hypothetical protein
MEKLTISKVIETELPRNSLLTNRIKKSDFLDFYSVQSNLSTRQAAEIITNVPGWARFLVKIRNGVVSKFGC